jgi:hypothetical protein
MLKVKNYRGVEKKIVIAMDGVDGNREGHLSPMLPWQRLGWPKDYSQAVEVKNPSLERMI